MARAKNLMPPIPRLERSEHSLSYPLAKRISYGRWTKKPSYSFNLRDLPRQFLSIQRMSRNISSATNDVACWHITSVIAVQRHVRSWANTGSDQHSAKVSRLMWWTTPAPGIEVIRHRGCPHMTGIGRDGLWLIAEPGKDAVSIAFILAETASAVTARKLGGRA